MNLIMSEVEETIMLVDAESVANGHGIVNVCCFFFLNYSQTVCEILYTGRKTKNGNVVCKRRWSYPCMFFILFYILISFSFFCIRY